MKSLEQRVQKQIHLQKGNFIIIIILLSSEKFYHEQKVAKPLADQTTEAYC